MFKKILSAALVAMMLCTMMLVPAYATHTTDYTVSFVPDLPANDTLEADCVLPSNEFTMAVKIEDSNAIGFYAVEIIVDFEDSLFTVEGANATDGRIIYRQFEPEASGWTKTYKFKAVDTISATTPGLFKVRANIVQSAEDAWEGGSMSYTAEKTITIVNQFNVTYYNAQGEVIKTEDTQTKINQDDTYEVPDVPPVEYHHLRWTIDAQDSGEYMTTAEVNAEKPSADSEVYLHEIPNTYEINVDTVTGTETATIAPSYDYDGITPLEGTIDNYDPRYDYVVTYSIVDTPFIEGEVSPALYSLRAVADEENTNLPQIYTGNATITNGNEFTIDAQYLKGPVQLTITKVANVVIDVKDFVAGENNDGWYLVRVYGNAAGYTFEDNGTEKAMYSYEGYRNGGKDSRVWLTQDLTPETANFDGVFAKLKVVNTASETIAFVGNDLNGDTVINFKDATLAYAAYILEWDDVQANIGRYIQADVTRDGILCAPNDNDVNFVLNDQSYVLE